MKTIKGWTIALLLVIIALHGRTQTKGSFDKTITFLNESRTLSCYVPTDYDSLQKYNVLIGLHGLGDNSANYRNALISARSWPAIFPKTIIICPDGGSDANKDFYSPAGDEEIISACIDFAKEEYSIDSSKIILQGFSLGGRSALKYGLEHPEKFMGLMLTTPAIQGIRDLENDSVASLKFKYENGNRIPVFMTVGDQDFSYHPVVEELARILKKTNTPLYYKAVAGVNHTIPDNTVNGTCLAFFNHPGLADRDMDLFEIITPEHSCGKTVEATCYVRNTGSIDISSVALNVSIGATALTHTWKGVLKPYEHVAIPVSVSAQQGGVQELKIMIGRIDSTETDPDTTDNWITAALEVMSDKGLSQSTEDFESDTPSWVVKPSANVLNWSLDTDVKRGGKASLASFNTILFFYTFGHRSVFSSPYIDIAGLKAKTISFEYAYNYHKYTPPYFTAEVAFADTLEVAVSTDCGKTYTKLFFKGGEALATAAGPIMNPLNITEAIFLPKDQEWRRETIDLTPYAASKNAIIRFAYISGQGGSVYIDNINVGSVHMDVNDAAATGKGTRVYPNPASDQLTLETGKKVSSIRIYDRAGKLVHNEQILSQQQCISVQLTNMENGLYIIEAVTETGVDLHKFIVAK